MKTIALLLPVLFVGCMSTPTKVYVQPEKFNCDLIIPTIWDGNHPVEHFQHEMILNAVYHDYMGNQYVGGRHPDVFASDRRAEVVTLTQDITYLSMWSTYIMDLLLLLQNYGKR